MKLIDYIKYMLESDLILNSNFTKLTFSLPVVGSKNRYFKIKDNRYIVIIDDKEYTLEDITTDRPIFNIEYILDIDPSWVINLDKPIKTTLGILMLNYVLLIYNFKDKIKYIEKDFDISKIEDTIANLLVEDKDLTNDKISIDEYINFVNACKYIESWGEIFVYSATPKSLLPPPDISKKKKEIIDKLKKKYNTEDPFKELKAVAELEDELKKIDKEWMKDDPSYGVVTSGKVMNTARNKMYLTMGSEESFVGNTKFIPNSLEDGWPTDPEELAGLFNTSRLGSFNRGDETKLGGLLAKIMLRAVNSIKIIDTDCKTNLGKVIKITENNHYRLLNRKIVGEKEFITDTKKYIGKTLTIRSPLYCKAKDKNFCKDCVSKGLSTRENGIAILVTDIADTILYISMKKMHNTDINLVDCDLFSMVK